MPHNFRLVEPQNTLGTLKVKVLSSRLTCDTTLPRLEGVKMIRLQFAWQLRLKFKEVPIDIY